MKKQVFMALLFSLTCLSGCKKEAEVEEHKLPIMEGDSFVLNAQNIFGGIDKIKAVQNLQNVLVAGDLKSIKETYLYEDIEKEEIDGYYGSAEVEYFSNGASEAKVESISKEQTNGISISYVDKYTQTTLIDGNIVITFYDGEYDSQTYSNVDFSDYFGGDICYYSELLYGMRFRTDEADFGIDQDGDGFAYYGYIDNSNPDKKTISQNYIKFDGSPVDGKPTSYSAFFKEYDKDYDLDGNEILTLVEKEQSEVIFEFGERREYKDLNKLIQITRKPVFDWDKSQNVYIDIASANLKDDGTYDSYSYSYSLAFDDDAYSSSFCNYGNGFKFFGIKSKHMSAESALSIFADLNYLYTYFDVDDEMVYKHCDCISEYVEFDVAGNLVDKCEIIEYDGATTIYFKEDVWIDISVEAEFSLELDESFNVVLKSNVKVNLTERVLVV